MTTQSAPTVHVLVADEAGKISAFGKILLGQHVTELAENRELLAVVQRVLETKSPENIRLLPKEPSSTLAFCDVAVKPRFDAKDHVTGAVLVVIEVPPAASLGLLEAKIRELDKINQALTIGLGKESALVLSQQRFLSVMSHEIRTPLNAVVASVELLDTSNLDATQRECLQAINAGSSVILRILNDVFDFSRLEAGTLHLDDVSFDLHHMFDECSALASRYCNIRGNKYSVQIEEKVPARVRGDGVRLRQVLLNLLNNACKFTHDGTISVLAKCRMPNADNAKGETKETTREDVTQPSAQGDSKETTESAEVMTNQQQGDQQPPPQQQGEKLQGDEATCGTKDSEPLKLIIQCEVVDTGVGMSTEILDKIFQPFTQCDQSSSRRFGGCGLGLAIVYRLLLLMHGKIEVKSTVGVGTTILFEVPLLHAAPHDAEVRLPPIPSIDVSLLDIVDAMPPSAILALGAVEAKAPSEEADTSFYQGVRSTTRILMADDSLINQKIAVKVLERLGWRADVCSNGLEAVKLLSENLERYNIIFLDAHMPVLDGPSALKQMRTAEKTTSSRRFVAVVTAEALTGSETKFLDMGFDAYLSKPITLNSVQVTLRAATSALAKWRGVWQPAGGSGLASTKISSY